MLVLAHISAVKKPRYLIHSKVSVVNQDFGHHFQQSLVYMLDQPL
jgi:hypothetical protein